MSSCCTLTNSAYVCITACVIWIGKVCCVWCSMRSQFYPHAPFLSKQIHITMVMSTLHYWSSLVECMKRVSCWPWTNSSCVCVAVWVHEFEVIILVFNAVWGRGLTLIMWCPNTLQWRWRLCVDLRLLLNVWHGRCVDPGQTGRTFWLLCVLELEHVIIGVWSSMLWGCNFIRMQHFAVQLLNTLLLRVVMLHMTNSAYVCITACVIWIGKVCCVWCSMRSQFYPHLPFCPNKYTLRWWCRLCIDHLCLLNVWNGCRVGSERTARAFVLLCVTPSALLYWFSMQYEVAVSPSSCGVQIHYDNDDDSALIFVCCWLFKHTTMAITALCWSSFVNYRVGLERTGRTFVLLCARAHVCVIAYGCAIN